MRWPWEGRRERRALAGAEGVITLDISGLTGSGVDHLRKAGYQQLRCRGRGKDPVWVKVLT